LLRTPGTNTPSRGLTIIGITGTNGKTTTTYILKSILEAWGKKVGLIGTIQYMIADAVYQATHTTPESLEFQALLHDMRAAGCSHVVTEISSHALTQKRIDNTIFKAGVFTNLTRDHLDFHGTMDDYFISKKRFFTDLLDRNAMSVINHDDAWGRRLSESIQTGQYTYGLEAGADMTASDMNNSFDGLKFRLTFRGRAYDIVSPLVGLPNVYNILSAAGAAASVGVPWEVILEGISKSPAIRGRFEKVDAGQKFLRSLTTHIRKTPLTAYLYCAKPDQRKDHHGLRLRRRPRPGQEAADGAIATRLSDFVIITSDNPRSERPETS